ncbi:ImmA/IrrE family metallo-endopeptidase [Rhizobium laguerreae]|uniref:ImmA/IrrE family metallo-endopeptidase n=1 Tax=Rhizobium laguerreae TaxID=1076926 RepID=UPI0028A59A98|nr:ImmA/IrrE family metallo-endopeptidase [Rhizobium laguerreae]
MQLEITVDPDTKNLLNELRKAGLGDRAIRAAWPAWWSDDMAASPSSRAELRFALARKLGLSPKPLLGERVEFIWKDKARFKHLSVHDFNQQDAMTSFGVSVGRLLLHATMETHPVNSISATSLRQAVLSNANYVDLQTLLATCWAIGIPVIHLRVFPLDTKSMHAMVVEDRGRHAILLGRDANYPAPVAFTLAHELGHIMLGHLEGASAIVDLEESTEFEDGDPQEQEADEFALTLLTSTPSPDIRTNISQFGARALAKAVLEAAPRYGIEPGTLALCLAYREKMWPTAIASLRHIYSESKPVWNEVNSIANQQLDWGQLDEESAEYLHNVMLGSDD